MKTQENNMSDSGYLHKYFLNNNQRRVHKWIHYFDIYEKYFARFRNKSPVMVEIGVAGGGSLQMWKDYFGPGCKIIGVDVKPKCKEYEEQDIEVFIGSQDDPKVWERVLSKYPAVDIILDDGSHVMNHMINTFNTLYEVINPYGVYMVEDAHTSYWPSHGGGLHSPDSFMEFAKRKVDEMHAAHTKGALESSQFTKSTDVIAFYDSIVVFERKPQTHKGTFMTAGVDHSLKVRE
jgi:hypothetical protein